MKGNFHCLSVKTSSFDKQRQRYKNEFLWSFRVINPSIQGRPSQLQILLALTSFHLCLKP